MTGFRAMGRPEAPRDARKIPAVGIPRPEAEESPLPRDYWVTVGDSQDEGTFQDLTIPAGFFGRDCEQFDGRVYFTGTPLDRTVTANVDTILERSDDPVVGDDPVGTVGTVDLDLVQLSLRSIEPITVTCAGEPERWTVHVGLSPTAAPTGWLTATKTHPNGGTFDSAIYIHPLLSFTRAVEGDPDDTQITDPGETLVWDTAKDSDPIELTIEDVPFANQVPPALRFYPADSSERDPGDTEFVVGIALVEGGTEPVLQRNVHLSPEHEHSVCAPVGACCGSYDFCEVMTEEECASVSGGEYKGDGTVCGPWGACCFGDGTCEEMYQICCLKMGGDPQGEEVACAPPPCCTVNLTIYEPQNGPAVAQSKEDKVGSYTVANLNDTDGDGRVDKDETNVRPAATALSAAAAQGANTVPVTDAAGFAVRDSIAIGTGATYQIVTITAINDATITFAPALGQAFANGTALGHRGRDEVDLMKLHLEGAGADGKTFELELVSGRAKVWTDATKQTEVALPKKYTDNPLSTDVWVEATAPSRAPRDIVLKLSCQGQDVEDTVAATGVWATVTAVLHDTKSAADIFDDPNNPNDPFDPDFKNMTDPPRDDVENVLGGVGLRPIPTDGGVHNVIAIKFKIQPPGINAEPQQPGRPRPRFDGSRRIDGKSWTKTGANACAENSSSTFPLAEEQSNDDINPDDKSGAPNSEDEYFDHDPPGLPSDNAFTFDLYIMRRNFQEFLRVRFDGTRPSGNAVDGSRCSPYYDWHVRHRLGKDDETEKWKRSDGEPLAAETNNNDVGPEHVAIGTCP